MLRSAGPCSTDPQQCAAKHTCCCCSWLRRYTRALPLLLLAVTWLQALLWDVALPSDYLVLAWDVVMLLVICHLCIAVPYTVAFAIDFVSGRRVLNDRLQPQWVDNRTTKLGEQPLAAASQPPHVL